MSLASITVIRDNEINASFFATIKTSVALKAPEVNKISFSAFAVNVSAFQWLKIPKLTRVLHPITGNGYADSSLSIPESVASFMVGPKIQQMQLHGRIQSVSSLCYKTLVGHLTHS
jgi:hypothetical protein